MKQVSKQSSASVFPFLLTIQKGPGAADFGFPQTPPMSASVLQSLVLQKSHKPAVAKEKPCKRR